MNNSWNVCRLFALSSKAHYIKHMTLQIGDAAPDFTLPATGKKNVSLQDYAGQQLVLYFYPKDDTPGCTQEACDFRDNIKQLEKLGVAVIGISKDSMKSHEKFAEKFQLNFPLASDEDAAVAQAYGIWGEKKFMGRTYMGMERATFLIDESGKIKAIWPKVKVTGHIDEVKKAITN